MYQRNTKDRLKKLLLELNDEIDRAWKTIDKDKENLKIEARELYKKIWEFREKL